jgi:heme/copper-type cytochrome/quinol oxidase subunit 2
MFAQVPLIPEQASTTAERVDALFLFQLAITTAMGVLVTCLILYFVARYRRRPG